MTEESLFAAILEQPAAEREPFLEKACGADAALRQRVRDLLAAHEKAAGILGPPADPSVPSGKTLGYPATSAVAAEQVGTVVGGRYKLLQQIGEGGMGTVFMAEQTEPVARKVAVKVIKAGMDSAQVIARFEAERQALAMMDHQNIARVLDAGTTDTGRPYFVMELVKGVAITKYCDDAHLTPRERLELFVPVCQAIQHAHQKGIIHRDIKPTNVLVSLYDGKPVPKVIDFGVAKATQQKLTERTIFTGFGALVGTLEYMSPEQSEMNQLDIDTRSDIYSLGVLLYELITGTTPLSRKQLRDAAYSEILRLIREVEPPKPSTRLSDAREALPSISAHRKTEPAKLTRWVRGELDWIVMKALSKERDRRYETANGFAADIQRFLSDEPVQAGPPSAVYRLRKFVQRNRGAVAGGVAVATLLVVGVAGLTVGTIVLTKQRQELQHAVASEVEARRQADEHFRAARGGRSVFHRSQHQPRPAPRHARHAGAATAVARTSTRLLPEIPRRWRRRSSASAGRHPGAPADGQGARRNGLARGSQASFRKSA